MSRFGKIISNFYKNPTDIWFIPGWIYSKFSYKSPVEADLPWFPYSVMSFVEHNLSKNALVFEYGSGGSTTWIASKVKEIVSVEHSLEWHDLISKQYKLRKVKNLTLILKTPSHQKHKKSHLKWKGINYLSQVESGNFEKYAKSIDRYPNKSFDLVIVDGRCRMACVARSISKVKKGGILLLDDSYRERYQIAKKLLHDWEKLDFEGIRPFASLPSQSTIWICPT